MKIPVCNYERALTRLTETERKAGNHFDGNVYLDVPEYYAVVEALEKQIPKKYEIWNGQCCCPNCNVMFGNYDDLKLLKSWKMDYCKFCGQALDWSDGERTDHNE